MHSINFLLTYLLAKLLAYLGYVQRDVVYADGNQSSFVVSNGTRCYPRRSVGRVSE